MKDKKLRQNLTHYIKKYGSSVTFIASRVGVSREHLSRWIHNGNYVISYELKTKLKLFLEGK